MFVDSIPVCRVYSDLLLLLTVFLCIESILTSYYVFVANMAVLPDIRVVDLTVRLELQLFYYIFVHNFYVFDHVIFYHFLYANSLHFISCLQFTVIMKVFCSIPLFAARSFSKIGRFSVAGS